ncbi:MAG: reactivating factor for ethanolamine ammonia lyase, partial [Proteobacteria bacterium]|nr:reactivating factor for ethanolamine ammonia lyase [Pseudomonadota bacterium]
MIIMAGFDFGTTTSSAVFARAKVVKNGITGVMEYATPEVFFAAEPRYTPYLGDRIDEAALAGYIDSWITAANVNPQDASAGGAIVTGLAAQKENASAIASLIRARIGDAVVATANDPSLESWLAFMGSARELSRELPDQAIINLDIGGGTTNMAFGVNGEVRSTGCLFVGARHVRVTPGTYRIEALSPYAKNLFSHLGLKKGVGENLSRPEVDSIVDFYLAMIRRTLAGKSFPHNDCEALHEQVPFSLPPDLFNPENQAALTITVSGGVGELVYRAMAGESPAAVTPFGDLGWDLALKLVADDWISLSLKNHVPKNMGRATAFGLALYNTEVSGTTVYLPDESILPLRDLPVVGRISPDTAAASIINLLELAAKSSLGCAIQVDGKITGAEEVQRFSAVITNALRNSGYPRDRTLVLLINGNVGKSLGALITS